MKKYSLITIVLALVLGSCDNVPITENESGISGRTELRSHISDGTTNGNPDFFFLPPLVPIPSFLGEFDCTQKPVVEIYTLNEAGNVQDVVASFTMISGPGSETVRVNPDGELYCVNWHTKDFALDNQCMYRIQVRVVETLLGAIDVTIVSSGSEFKNVNTNECIPLKDGRTLPIKFRIQKGAVYLFNSQGGDLSVFNETLSLNVPPNALPDAAAITIHPCAVEGPNGFFVLEDGAYDFGPDGLTFTIPVTVTIAYDPENLFPGISETEITLFTTENGTWIEVPGSIVNTTANTVSGQLWHFSKVVSGIKYVRTVDIIPSSEIIRSGETLQLEAIAKNDAGSVVKNKNVTWTSSADAIASVKSGVVTAIAPGEVIITGCVNNPKGNPQYPETVCGTASIKVLPAIAIPEKSYFFDGAEFAKHMSPYTYGPGANDFAYGAWIKVRGSDYVKGRFMDTHNTNNWYSNRFGLFVPGTEHSMMCITNYGTSNHRIKLYSTTPPEQDKWYHVVCVRRSGVMYMYINSVVDNSIANNHNIPASGYMTLGGSAYNRYGYPSGDINGAHVFVVDGTVTENDVKDLYSGVKTPLQIGTSCKGWWKFDEGAGTIVHDASGFGVDLRLTTGDNWQ